MEFTAQNIEYAVSVFYNGEQDDRAKAHTWLTTAQRVPEAWIFVWELLQPTKVTEVQFYAATTLHTKILRCWNEVPPESYEELRDKLLQAVFTYAKGPKIVTNRLCISLAAFILQQGSVDLATILSPLSNVENASLLLEVLTVLPEEFSSMTMGSALRSKNRASLRQACPAVLADMLRYLQTVYNDYSNEPPSEQIMQSWLTAASCAASWLTIDGEDTEFGPALPERMPLFRALLTAVHVLYTCNEIISDAALDTCEACMSAARAAGGTAEPGRYPTVALDMFNCLAALVTPIMAKHNVPNSVNEELLSALIMCCVALAETHSRTIVDGVDTNDERAAGAKQIVEILLDAQNSPGRYPVHETRSNLVFGFWYTLQGEVANTADSVWNKLFCRLLTILIHKAEAMQDSMMSKDDLELLRCYRQDISDTVMYCYAMVGEYSWSAVEAEVHSGGAGRREAALHVFLALADAAPHARQQTALTALLRHAVRYAEHPDSQRELHTALHCLGAYATWIASLGSAGAALAQECVSAAGGALCRGAGAAAPAALALRRLCEECTEPASQLAGDIVRAAMNSSGQDVWTRRQLMSAAGSALAATELDFTAPLIQDIAAMLYADLVQQACDPTSGAGAAECTAAFIGAMTLRQKVGADLFRVLVPTLRSFAPNPLLVESMFCVLRQTVFSLVYECVPLLSDIAELTVTAFNHHPCPAGLDVVKLAVIIYGKEWPEYRNLLRVGVELSARKVAQDPPASNDIVEALFTMLLAVTKKRPHYLEWLDDLLPDLVELASRCIRVWEAGAARSACNWISALAAVRPQAIQDAAPALTAIALRCIGGATPRNQVHSLAELLLALNRAEWRRGEEAGLATWLRQALDAPGFPSHHATHDYKHKFIAAVIKEKSSKSRLLETVQEFSLVCRGLVGTEYARQSIATKQLVA